MTISSKAIPVERGCVTRVAGGVYAELGFGAGGRQLEDFLIDPPHVIANPAALGLTPRGVKLVEVNSVWHIVDWVGSQHYPNVADFLEEVRRFGLSRRLPRNLDFSKLNENSRVLLMHARAHIQNFQDYVWSGWVNVKYNRCPKEIDDHEHTDPPMMCAGVFYQDVEGGQPVESGHQRLVNCEMPSFSYVAARRPEGVEPKYQPAIFASFPVSRLVVVRDLEGGSHDATAKNARQSSLPVELEDE